MTPVSATAPRRRASRVLPETGKVLFALVFTLVVNGVGLGVITRLNLRAIEVPEAEARVVTAIDFTTPPPKQPREVRPEPPRPQREPLRRRTTAAVPNAPSRIAAERLEAPNLDAGGLIDGAALEGSLSRDMRLVFREEEVDEPPRLIHRVSPSYPVSAADRGITGEVRFRALVGTDGNVERIEIVSSDPPGVFDSATRSSVMRWRFRPAVYDGRTVSVWTRSRLVFRLE